MAFSLDCRYVPGTGIVYATFDGLIISEAEVQQLFAQLTREVSWLPRPVYMVADFNAWRVETAVMRVYGRAMRAFRDATDTCLAGYSGDIYARMNVRLPAVIGGSSSNLFATQEEAVAYVKEQQRLTAQKRDTVAAQTSPR